MGRPLFPEFRSERFDPEKRKFLKLMLLGGAGLFSGACSPNKMQGRDEELERVGKALYDTYDGQKEKRSHYHYYASVSNHAFDGEVSAKELEKFDGLALKLYIHPHRVLYTIVSNPTSACLTGGNAAPDLEKLKVKQKGYVRGIHEALLGDKELLRIAVKIASVKGGADRLKIIGHLRFDRESEATY